MANLRVWESGASSTPPTPPVSPVVGWPTKGNPGAGIPATKGGEYWFYQLAVEWINLLAAAGITPDHTSLTQLRDAVLTLVSNAQRSIVLTGAVFASGVVDGNAVRWDASAGKYAKAVADGTSNDAGIGFADVTNSKVYLAGLCTGLFSGLTPGARYYLSSVTAGAITPIAPAGDTVFVGIALSATDLVVDVDVQQVSAYPIGTVFANASSTVPANCIAVPTAATTLSRATYSALFAALGTTWGAGDGSTTFGIPYLPADYTPVQANGNLGTFTVGQVIAHTHSVTTVSDYSLAGGSGGAQMTSSGNTGSTGGAANLAAGARMRWYLKYQ